MPAQPADVAAEIAVPTDAVLPEPGTGRLRPVGAGTIAREKLTYRVLGSAFHDGTRMTPTDLLYSYMFAYRWGVRGDGGGSHFDPLVAAATAVMRARLAGARVVATDTTSKSFRVGDFEFVRELFVVEVYMSTPPLEPEQDAIAAPPWSTLPWHLLVLMEEAVERGWAAFSQAEADRRGVAWLDLVRSEGMNKQLVALVEAVRAGRLPSRSPAVAGERGGRAQALDARSRHSIASTGTSWSPMAPTGSSAGRPTAPRSKRSATSAIRSASAHTTPMPFRAAVTSPRSKRDGSRVRLIRRHRADRRSTCAATTSCAGRCRPSRPTCSSARPPNAATS